MQFPKLNQQILTQPGRMTFKGQNFLNHFWPAAEPSLCSLFMRQMCLNTVKNVKILSA